MKKDYLWLLYNWYLLIIFQDYNSKIYHFPLIHILTTSTLKNKLAKPCKWFQCEFIYLIVKFLSNALHYSTKFCTHNLMHMVSVSVVRRTCSSSFNAHVWDWTMEIHGKRCLHTPPLPPSGPPGPSSCGLVTGLWYYIRQGIVLQSRGYLPKVKLRTNINKLKTN